MVDQVLTCCTVLTWWQWECQWGIRHGLQLAGITLLWLVGLNIDQDRLVTRFTMGSRNQWEFPPFFSSPWQSFCTALTAGKWLPLELCEGTVKESNQVWTSGKLCPRYGRTWKEHFSHHTHLNVTSFRFKETTPQIIESMYYVFMEDIASIITEVVVSWMPFAFAVCHHYIQFSNNISNYQSYPRLTFSFKAKSFDILLITY